ncbi:MAG: Fe-S cluster assembly protein SufD [Bacteroidia bacterium]
METITKKTILKNKLITQFQSSKNTLFGSGSLRELAINFFEKQGIPTRKHEEYKYLNLDVMLKGEFSSPAKKSLTSQQINSKSFLKNAKTIVIENGFFNQSLSTIDGLPKEIQILDICKSSELEIFKNHYSKYADISTDAFIALNTAMAVSGVFIYIPKGIVFETPIHILHISSVTENTFTNPRNLIVVGENAQVQLIESYQSIDSTATTINNALTEIVIEENANVNHYKIQDESEFGYLINTTQIYQKSKSVFTTNTFILSGALVRNNLTIVLDGEHIETHLNGLYLTKDNQVVDNHTLVDHWKSNCNSNELYKGIIEDKSSATFNGKIFVRKDAQKTNAFQSNKNILLSDDGTVNTKPQLEIYADDVKCSHGTSTGKLDTDKIFYLRARGLSELSAKKMLMHAFASEVVEGIKLPELLEYVEAKVTERFE